MKLILLGNHIRMLQIFIPIIFVAICGCEPKQSEVRIAIMGDQTGTRDLDSAYSIMTVAAGQMVKHSPDLLVHVGDMTESRGRGSSQYATDFQTAVGIMESVGTPWYLTAGDHDVNPAKFEPQSTDRSNEKRFQELCVGIGLPMEERLYYSVDFQGYHLVFLYSLENLHTDPRWGSIFLNGISDEQLKWLQSDLEQHRDTKGTIVITHHPHWYSWSNWFPVHKVLRAYSVIAVIGGHFHYDQDDGVIDGINYMVVGATGGGIKDADVESGGSYQYALLTLEGQNLSSYELREVFSDSLLERTSRRSMDRIQAISASMSNAYRDENLIMQDGMILSIDGNGHETIKTLIDIESIQNPIDLPVELSIYPVDSKLIAPRWVGSKAGKNGAYSIILEPGERCGWANYSNSGQWITPDAIWEADIVKDALKMAESPAIGVKLKMEYVDTRPRWISSQINFHVKSAKNQSENFLYK